MKKNEICRKIVDFGKCRQRTIIYYMLKSVNEERKYRKTSYGISIRIEETGEEAAFADVTTDRAKIMKLLDLLASNHVTPVTLGDVVYDWLE